MAYKPVDLDLKTKFYHRKTTRAEYAKAASRTFKYKKPILTSIKLDTRQAILAQCQVDGMFMGHAGPGWVHCIGTQGTGNWNCGVHPVRGYAGGAGPHAVSYDEPS